ncbi:unnamed protein product [Didymodactylos carnosus]|uniref:Uncharacterized protein n=1 Tax=Didymodactylos carnosus TaxID=1234261 RepID=A0A815H548_9BILA|nr:unnamed protein product [Didymodactylos carnosus]CAF4212644.1 unnamed protein product [Didymodactylos carnosus]
MHMFALILNCNTFLTALEAFKSIVNIFGDPLNNNAETVLDKFLVVDAPIDNYDESIEESGENNAVDEVNDPPGEVDDLEQPEVPIVQQSSFTCEANNQIPLLNTLSIDQKNGNYPDELEQFTYQQAGRCGAIVDENYLEDTFESDLLTDDNIRKNVNCCAAERIYLPKEFVNQPPFCIIDLPHEDQTRTNQLPNMLRIGNEE